MLDKNKPLNWCKPEGKAQLLQLIIIGEEQTKINGVLRKRKEKTIPMGGRGHLEWSHVI